MQFILWGLTSDALAQELYCSHSKIASQPALSAQPVDPRLDLYDVRHVFLNLNADNQSTFISGEATVTVVAKAELSSIVLELTEQLNVLSVEIEGQAASYNQVGDLIEISLSNPVGQGEIINCSVTYSGEPNPGTGIFSGINNAVSSAWENQVTWTLSEPFNAKLWWPCKQVLTDKIDSVWVFVTTDNHLKVGSNGLLTNTVNLPNNKVRYEWKSNYPIAYYLISMTIAEYVEYNNYAKPEALVNDSILIQNYIYNNPETLPYYRDELDDIPEMIELFSDYYVLYPFHEEKYGHAMAPFSGGMEHQTMSSMGLFTFTLDAHELGHQWFGDLVTCATWQDIWVNEGFARFSEYLALEKLLSFFGAEQYRMNDMEVVLESATAGSVYVPEENANNEARIFNYVLTYLKGGLIIHMVREIVNNDELFFDVIKVFLEKYEHSAATGEDFKNVLEEVTGEQFDDFFEQWYYGEGYPVFDITWQTTTDSLRLSIDQSATGSTDLFTTPLEFALSYAGGETDTFRISQTQNIQKFSVPISGTVEKLVFNPDKWLIAQLDRFVRLDENGNALATESTLNLSVYPNPAGEMLMLSKPLDNIRILDIHGKVVWQIRNTPTENIDIAGFPPGVYFLESSDRSRAYRIKFLVRS